MNPERKELKNFLGGTFHQDITSPEEALEDYIESVDKDWILNHIGLRGQMKWRVSSDLVG